MRRFDRELAERELHRRLLEDTPTERALREAYRTYREKWDRMEREARAAIAKASRSGKATGGGE